MKKNVFIIGQDTFNFEKLKRLPEASECNFYPAIYYEEMRGTNLSIPFLIDKAFERIEAVGKIDAIVSYFDFPGTDIVPIIAKKYNIPGPELESVLKCEHKYWSRLEQQKAIPQHIPKFVAFDPFNPEAYNQIDIIPPFWIKPIKSFRSYLAYIVNSEVQFHEYMDEVQAHINELAEPFNYFFQTFHMPNEIADMSESCIAESPLFGHQCTIEGYVYESEVVIYGIIDSVREENRSSFARYEYPSSLPQEIQFRMADITRRAIVQIGLNNSPFNIEFFYDSTINQIFMLEINPRISQSHASIFEKVHGMSHHDIMLNIALGRRPKALEYRGNYRVAANFMLRTYEAGLIKSIPDEAEISAIRKKYPEFEMKLFVSPGQHLKQLPNQDSYSYELANIFLGAKDQQELLDKYHTCLNDLTFDIEIDKSEVLH